MDPDVLVPESARVVPESVMHGLVWAAQPDVSMGTTLSFGFW